MFPLSIYNYFEIFALFCGLAFWKNIRNTPRKWLVPFLLFIVLVELYGRYLRMELKELNAWLYNFSVPLEFLFYTYLFYRHYQKRQNKFAAIVFAVSFVLFASIYLAINGTTVFNGYMLMTGNFFTVVFSLLFLFELYNRPGMIQLSQEPMFWISTGLLFFCAGGFSYALLQRIAALNQLDEGARIFRSINNYLVVFLYLCISISFVCRKDSTTSKQIL